MTNTVDLDHLVERPECLLMKGMSDSKCDVPTIRSMFPEQYRNTCACNSKCIVRSLGVLPDGSSVISAVNFYQAQRKPIPFDEIQKLIDERCSVVHPKESCAA